MSAEKVPVRIRVNERSFDLEIPAHHTLLDVLRDDVGSQERKSVVRKGSAARARSWSTARPSARASCLPSKWTASSITTIEGLASHGQLDPIQEAFVATGAVQCGFCIPGMIMAARQLLASNPHPTRAEIQEGLAGNLCRCGGYSRIVDAVASAAGSRR